MTTDRHPIDLSFDEVVALRVLIDCINVNTPSSFQAMVINHGTMIRKAIGKAIDGAQRPITGETSDGYHTFNELYEHRHALFIALCRLLTRVDYTLVDGHRVWRSKLHSDGTSFEGWFVMGIGTESGAQITYHLPMKHWEATWFAVERPRAPDFDGHTSADVLQRLRRYW